MNSTDDATSGSLTGSGDADAVLALLIISMLILFVVIFLPCIVYLCLQNSPRFRAWFHRKPYHDFTHTRFHQTNKWRLRSKGCQTDIVSVSITTENIRPQAPDQAYLTTPSGSTRSLWQAATSR